jgi:transcriptional regulator with XRE-family HTH domain
VSVYDDDSVVVPDGGRVRLLRHRRGWSRRELVEAIARAREREAGLRETLSLNLLEGIEENDEPVPFATLRLLASGLDCQPVELVREPEAEAD